MVASELEKLLLYASGRGRITLGEASGRLRDIIKSCEFKEGGFIIRTSAETATRALDLLASLHLVERLDLPEGDHAYVACDASHHHHAICTDCGRSLDIDDLGLSDVLSSIGARSGFRVSAHRLEVFGTCASCTATAAEA